MGSVWRLKATILVVHVIESSGKHPVISFQAFGNNEESIQLPPQLPDVARLGHCPYASSEDESVVVENPLLLMWAIESAVEMANAGGGDPEISNLEAIYAVAASQECRIHVSFSHTGRQVYRGAASRRGH